MNRFTFAVQHDALAIAELSTTPSGLLAADAATKAAEVNVVYSGSIHPGKFLIVLDGGVFETELALNAICDIGRKRLIDAIHLPFPHPQLRAPQKTRVGDAEPALMSLETFTIPSLLGAIDKILKSTNTVLRLLQLADHLGGKSVAVLEGELSDIEAAEAYVEAEVSKVLLSDLQLIRRPSRQFVESFLSSLRD